MYVCSAFGNGRRVEYYYLFGFRKRWASKSQTNRVRRTILYSVLARVPELAVTTTDNTIIRVLRGTWKILLPAQYVRRVPRGSWQMGFKGFSEIVFHEKHNNLNIYIYIYERIPLLLDTKKQKYIYTYTRRQIFVEKKREKNFCAKLRFSGVAWRRHFGENKRLRR